jgi:hypothetical protein
MTERRRTMKTYGVICLAVVVCVLGLQTATTAATNNFEDCATFQLWADGDSSAVWSTEQANSTTHSIKLIVGPSTAEAGVRVPLGCPLSAIPTVDVGGTWKVVDTTKVYYQAYSAMPSDQARPEPWMTLRLDTNGDGQVDFWLNEPAGQQQKGHTDEWVTCTPFASQNGETEPPNPVSWGGGGGWFGYDLITHDYVWRPDYPGVEVAWNPLGWWQNQFPTATVVEVGLSTGYVEGALYLDDLTLMTTQVPEPATMTLLVLGGGALALLRRRRK